MPLYATQQCDFICRNGERCPRWGYRSRCNRHVNAGESYGVCRDCGGATRSITGYCPCSYKQVNHANAMRRRRELAEKELDDYLDEILTWDWTNYRSASTETNADELDRLIIELGGLPPGVETDVGASPLQPHRGPQAAKPSGVETAAATAAANSDLDDLISELGGSAGAETAAEKADIDSLIAELGGSTELWPAEKRCCTRMQPYSKFNLLGYDVCGRDVSLALALHDTHPSLRLCPIPAKQWSASVEACRRMSRCIEETLEIWRSTVPAAPTPRFDLKEAAIAQPNGTRCWDICIMLSLAEPGSCARLDVIHTIYGGRPHRVITPHEGILLRLRLSEILDFIGLSFRKIHRKSSA